MYNERASLLIITGYFSQQWNAVQLSVRGEQYIGYRKIDYTGQSNKASLQQFVSH
jgi:hypothetical protein